MTPNPDKIEEAVLALLHPTSFLDKHGGVTATRAWKSHDWDALDRLHQKGFISDPKSRSKSVLLSEEGARQAEALFHRLFCHS